MGGAFGLLIVPIPVDTLADVRPASRRLEPAFPALPVMVATVGVAATRARIGLPGDALALACAGSLGADGGRARH